MFWRFFFFFQAEDGIRDYKVTGVQTCALPIFDTDFFLGIEGAQLADDGIGVGANRLRVVANPRSPEDPGGPVFEVVALEGLEQRSFDLRLSRDGGELDAATFALLAKACAEACFHRSLHVATGVAEQMC